MSCGLLIQLPFEHLQQEILLHDAPMWDRQEVLPVPLYIYGQQRLPSKIPQLNSRRPLEGWDQSIQLNSTVLQFTPTP